MQPDYVFQAPGMLAFVPFYLFIYLHTPYKGDINWWALKINALLSKKNEAYSPIEIEKIS